MRLEAKIKPFANLLNNKNIFLISEGAYVSFNSQTTFILAILAAINPLNCLLPPLK